MIFFLFFFLCLGGMDGCVGMVERLKRSPTGYGILFVRFATAVVFLMRCVG